MKVRVSAVSYLNTLPFLYGINHSDIKDKIELSLDIPSDCAKKLLNNDVDLGLVPVAILPELKEYHIVSDYCIGANGKVDSVALFSDVPLDEIEGVYLDFQSKTSIALVQLLAEHYWHISPQWLDAEVGFENSITGNNAGVIIGDRTFRLPKKFKYKYDLAEAWKDYTGLPFVFACWVSNKKLSKEFISQFNDALSIGINNVDKVVSEVKNISISEEILLDYLSDKIDYTFDKKKQEALNHFLNPI